MRTINAVPEIERNAIECSFSVWSSPAAPTFTSSERAKISFILVCAHSSPCAAAQPVKA